MPAWLKRIIDRLKASHAYSAWQRYGAANGDLLAAGVGYFAFFSVFPALALAFAIFGFVLQGRPDLVETIAASLDGVLPGMVKSAAHPDGIISVAAPASLTLTVTGVVSFVTLLLAGLGWVGALRTGIRGVFGLEAAAGNAVRTKARDLVVLVTLGLAIAVSAILTSVIGGLAERVAGWVGLAGNGLLIGALGLLLGVAFDFLILVVLLRMLSGVPLPMHNVRQGALVGAVILTVLKLFGGFLIGRATANPLLGAVAVAVGLLFWLNLMSKVVLLSAAWAANQVDIARLADGTDADTDTDAEQPAAAGAEAAAVRARPRPTSRDGAATAPPAPAAPPATRATDRVSIAAGVLVGIATTLGARGIRGALRR
ncbi:YihY/virulence factor BrkB family protein [Terrabacter sp. 2RAF25]|uniref:YihY/virulence factor BrkB family protein n=1 Tax=Terrabacter sp. 2RAF25 TaxID=3232998 RepID=UPI003F9B189F